ncbi:hypothetical protein [Nocardioides albus]|uniref:Uncharacterized protein n=1 Tax=Nocardioides albus TaxID=1841 RepID=A0A7W5A2B5_9ACTN|nr:hypothetical protein [Nocardioides albus]MBB3088115.1 hypothetical protein [Nocardioides albus]GGU22626.1 hypothetical protein GCM10007979_21820 [Nocardioides albus]
MNAALAHDLRRLSHDSDRWLADARERLSRRVHATPAKAGPTTEESTDE